MRKKSKAKPRPPASLDAQGKRIWSKWVDAVTDYDLLENYAIAYQTMIMATKSVAKHGATMVSTSDRGYEMIKKNPACDVQATAQRTMIACSRKLGLSGVPEQDAFSEFD